MMDFILLWWWVLNLLLNSLIVSSHTHTWKYASHSWVCKTKCADTSDNLRLLEFGGMRGTKAKEECLVLSRPSPYLAHFYLELNHSSRWTEGRNRKRDELNTGRGTPTTTSYFPYSPLLKYLFMIKKTKSFLNPLPFPENFSSSY